MKVPCEFGFDEEIYQCIGDLNSPVGSFMSGITFPDPNYEIIYRNASSYSIEYVYEGSGVIQQNNNIYKVSAGDFFVLHPGYVHYYTNPHNPWKKIWINTNGAVDCVSHILSIFDMSDLVYIPKINTPLELENILELARTEPPDISEKLVQLLFNLFFTLNHIIKNRPKDSSVPARAKLYIDKSLRNKLTVEGLAKYFSLSPDYFCRIFKKEHGVSPSSYILNQRVEHSKAFLKTTNLSINELAMYFNFYDVPHFVRSFKKIVGCSPTEYRQKYQDSDENEVILPKNK